jgi:ABC-type amino acid transport substrate-binding protein
MGVWVAGLLVLGLPACRRTDEAWEHVLATGRLRVGMDASFPPFEYVAADGTLAGFDVDLARALGRRLGVEVEFVANLPYDGLYDALTIGHVDAVISALVVNPDRMADFAFSRSYFDAGQVLVTLPNAPALEGRRALEGGTLAVEFGSRGDLEARRWARRTRALTLVAHTTPADALAAVRTGEADAALVDRVSALAAAGDDPALVIAEQPVTSELYAVAVRRESSRLLEAIDEALAEMEEDGTLEGLVAQWMYGP